MWRKLPILPFLIAVVVFAGQVLANDKTEQLDQSAETLNDLLIQFGLISVIILLVIVATMVFLRRFVSRIGGDFYQSREFKIFGLLSVVIFVGSVFVIVWVTLARLEQQIRDETANSLQTVLSGTFGTLKVWVDGHLRATNALANDQNLRHLVRAMIVSHSTRAEFLGSGELETIRWYFEERRQTDEELGFSIINRQKINVAATTDEKVGKENIVNKYRPELLDQALAGHTLVVPPIPVQSAANDLSDLDPAIFVLAPIVDSHGHVMAVLARQLDAHAEYKTIMSAGRLGQSGETYLVDQTGLMISQSRHDDGIRELGLIGPGQSSILNIRIVDPGQDLSATIPPPPVPANSPYTYAVEQLMDGASGSDSDGYRDYRGIAVFGAWAWSDFFQAGLITEIDADEAMARYDNVQTLISIIVGAAVLMGLGLASVSVWVGRDTNLSLRRTRDELTEIKNELEIRVEARTQALAEKEAQLSHAIQNMPNGIILLDDDMTVKLLNDRYTELYELPAGILDVGSSLTSLIEYRAHRGDYGPGDPDKLIEERVAGYEEPDDIQIMENKMASGRVIELVRKPLLDGGMVAISTDITERKRAEAALAREKQIADLTLENMSDGLLLLDKDLNYQLFNKRYVELIGLPEHMIEVGKPIRAVLEEAAAHGFYGDGDVDQLVEARMAAFENDEYVEVEIQASENRTLNVRKTSLEAGGAVAIFSDITERKQAEAALSQSQERLSKILEVSPAAAAIITYDGIVMTANPRFNELFGFADEQIVGRNMIEFYQEREHLSDIIAKLETDGIVEEQLITYRRRNGSEFEVLLTMVEIAFPEGKRNIVWLYDVTELRAIQRELADAKELAEEAAKAKADFLATMSHEIRTPMNGVMSMAEILDQTVLSSDQRSMTKVIRGSAEALLTVINDILDFSKIEAGKLDIEKISFDVMELAESAADLLAPRAEESALDMLVEVDPSIPRELKGDPIRIRQILLNLGSNAVKFTKEGGVAFRLKKGEMQENGHLNLRFEIEDTGVGLTEEQIGKLFTAFSQAESSTSRKFGGTGLGLSICKRLVELMGGEIDVTSVPGQGSTFWFELPFEVLDSREYTSEHDISEANILMAGYSQTEREVIERYLRHAGVTAITHCFDRFDRAPVISDALDALNGQEPDLILLNGKPGLHGVREQLDALKTDVMIGSKPVIVSAFHGAASTLAADQKTLRGLRLLSTMTAPISASRLWFLVAVGMGKAELTDKDEIGAVTTYSQPSKELAQEKNAVVLVAEDNETNQVVIHRILSRLGLVFEIAIDGFEALKLYNSKSYGMLLTDFHMPNMDGFELTGAIRRKETEKNIADEDRLPIVALTADALADTEQQCLDAGMDGYLRKPIEIAKLEEALQTYLPIAFEIRCELTSEDLDAEENEPEAGGIEAFIASVDSEIFDPQQLADTFGEFDESAAQTVLKFTEDLRERVADLQTMGRKNARMMPVIWPTHSRGRQILWSQNASANLWRISSL